MRSENLGETIFYPEKRSGTIFHMGAVLVLIGLAGFGLLGVTRAQVGPDLLVYLLPLVVSLLLIPVFLYQLYALRTATYILSRDGLQIRWGLRNEVIPITAVIGIGKEGDLQTIPPWPFMRLPGVVMGVRALAPRTGEPAAVEYLAASLQEVVYLGTPARLYAISPADPLDFIEMFSRYMELGSLSPLSARSIYPSVMVSRIWASRSARLMLLGSITLSLLLLVEVSLSIPGRSTVHLRFETGTAARDLVPGVRLLLLPVLAGIITLVDWLVGLVLFRRDNTRELAFIVWGAAVVIPILFILAAYFILQSG